MCVRNFRFQCRSYATDFSLLVKEHEDVVYTYKALFLSQGLKGIFLIEEVESYSYYSMVFLVYKYAGLVSYIVSLTAPFFPSFCYSLKEGA